MTNSSRFGTAEMFDLKMIILLVIVILFGLGTVMGQLGAVALVYGCFLGYFGYLSNTRKRLAYYLTILFNSLLLWFWYVVAKDEDLLYWDWHLIWPAGFAVMIIAGLVHLRILAKQEQSKSGGDLSPHNNTLERTGER